MNYTMDELTIDECRKLNTLGFITITGNGHVAAVVEEDKVEEYEESRCEHGF